MKRLASILTLVLILGAAGYAAASSSDTSDVACGSAPAGWNVPKGAISHNRGASNAHPVTAVIDAIGEYRTHNMMSHGPGGWVTHQTMHAPGTTGWPTYCSTPMRPEELQKGYPGASQIPQGALYTYLYSGSGQAFLMYQRSMDSSGLTTKGAEIADYLWSSVPYWWVTSKQSSSYGLYRIGPPGGSPLNYSLYQFRDIQTVHQGGVGVNNGMVCSTIPAWAMNKKGFGTVNPHTYSHSTLVAAGNALYNATEKACNDGLGFWAGVGSAITCFENICDDAARQMRNCMAANKCDSDDSKYWTAVRDNSATVSVAISPDRLGGWSGHPWTGTGVSVWAYDSFNSVQWNQGGSTYGCWF